MPRHIRTSPTAIRARERATRAVDLKKAGFTLQQIANELGYRSAQAAWYAITSALDRQELESVTDYRNLQRARLERLLMGLWSRATAGEDKAVQNALRIIEQLCRLDNLYAPTTAEVAVVAAQPLAQWIPDQEWMRLFNEAWAEVRESTAFDDDDAPALESSTGA